ncbi:hypothetical protein CR513_10919, partial [Mucuna pruriens]
MLIDRNTIDVASGGTLMDKKPNVARKFISNMGFTTFKGVNEVIVANNQRLEIKITGLTSLVRQLAIRHHHTSLAKVCSICAFAKHITHTSLKVENYDLP